MSDARKRLQEAEFFLERLRATENLHPDFDYFLNAFVSSARSVLWVMRHEYSAVLGWAEWFDSTELTSPEQVIFDRFNQARIRSQKRGPLTTSGRAFLDIPPESATEELKQVLGCMAGRTLKVTLSAESVQEVSPTRAAEHSCAFAATLQDVWHVLPEFPDQNVVTACSEYCGVLESVISECERRFPITEEPNKSADHYVSPGADAG